MREKCASFQPVEGIAALIASNEDLELVGQASNGADGVEEFRKQRPDVTLMDLQMPGLHGIDAITAIREQAPNAAIIVLTTFAGDVQVRRALKAGAQAFLLKDVLQKELLDTIRSVHVIGQCIRHIGRNHPAPCSDDCGEARNSPSLAERYPK